MSKKIISINPELFKVQGGTRKKRSSDNTSSRPEIKIRSPSKPRQNTIRSKNHVLRFIRDQQEKNYKKILSPDSTPAKPEDSVIPGSQDFNSDFDESLKYMMSFTEQQKNAPSAKNKTLKQNSVNPLQGSLLFHPTINTLAPLEEMVNVGLPDVFDTTNYSIAPKMHLPKPQYGCMKYGGTLPTYRQLHNITQRRPILNPSENTVLQPIHIPSANATPMPSEPMIKQDRLHEIKKTAERADSVQKASRLKYPKQRRTVRRTFRLGKSKVHPKISVLVSNRTLRNNITTKSYMLKQTPIPEIKRYLIKKGFIKVGSGAPNDVLRKMYESASMIGGEVQNHNPENLLYNYFNDIDSTIRP